MTIGDMAFSAALQSELRAARELAVIAARREVSDGERIKRLEAAVQAMAAAIRPLRSQGEDYIWRAADRALTIADDAILDRFLASVDTQPKAGDASSAAPLVSGAVGEAETPKSESGQ